ncbi:MAG: TRAP transporter small permease [Desulfomonile sp.]|nr:TRAP transporter small permease [Desulfomonile sp.]
MKTLVALTTTVSRVMFTIAGIAMTASVVLTCSDVILRIFRRPIMGTYELVGILGAIMVGFAIPQTTRVQGHVIMDFLTTKLPEAWQTLLRVVTRLLGVGLFFIMGWNLWILGNDFLKSGETTMTLGWPFYPVAYGLAICCLIECVVLLVEIFERRRVEP